MKVKVLIKDCVHLPDISVYNHNYYKLPVEVNGYDILREDWCDCNGFLGHSLCILEEGKMKQKLYLNTFDGVNEYDCEYALFDSDELSDECEYG